MNQIMCLLCLVSCFGMALSAANSARAQQVPEPPPALLMDNWDYEPNANEEVPPEEIDWHVDVEITNGDDRGTMIATVKVQWQKFNEEEE